MKTRHLSLSRRASRWAVLPLGWLLATLVGVGAGPASHAAEVPAGALQGLQSTAAQLRLTAERVKLPGSETMGLVGTSYLVEIAPGWSFGPAAYGAITGERGGLFTVGAELGGYRRLSGPLGLDVGVYLGGGGGGSAPVGSGLMLRPHADLVWDFAGQRAGLSVSRVRFSEGRIDSTQVGLVWTALTDFRHVGAAGLGDRQTIKQRSGIGFDRMQAVVGAYQPRSGSQRLDGRPLEGRIGFAGARFERALGEHLFWGLEAAGAASGGVAGYAEYLGTVGLESEWLPNRLYVGTRLAAGMGGGGEVDVGGGLLLKGGVYGTLRLAGDLGLTVEAGLARSPQGRFEATYTSASLVWVLDERRRSLVDRGPAIRMEWVGGFERYPAVRRDGSTRDLRAVSLRVNRFVSERLYLTGQAHSALGGGAGGYSVGLLGAGYQQRWGRWQAGAEALVGAAGGGGVDTAGGLVAQPMVYAGYALSPDLALRVGGGRIEALRGPLSGNVFEVSLAYTFGVGGRGGR